MKNTILEHLDGSALAEAFNAVYEDYVIPVNVSEAHIDQHVNSNDIDLAVSPLWLDDDGSVIGVAMLGVRGNRGWVGGFGITKPYRGRGLSHRLIAEVIERGRGLNLREIVLEVITTNAAAIRTYERAGFAHHRDLLILVRKPSHLTLDIDTSGVTQADRSQVLANRAQTAVSRSWQNEPASLANDDNLVALRLGPGDAPQATIVYSSSDPLSARIADIAAIDQESAQVILAAIIQRESGKTISLVNEPEASAALPALLDLGWIEVMRQHEMVLTLTL